MIFHFIDPLFDVLKRLLFRDIVDEESAETFAVMRRCYCFKSFLAGYKEIKLVRSDNRCARRNIAHAKAIKQIRLLTRVPYLYAHRATSLQWNWLSRKLYADGRTFLLRQLSLNIATEQVRFANIGVS